MKGGLNLKQYDAVDVISKALIIDRSVEAILLKGSLARQEEDEYSDVDLCVVVSKEGYEELLAKRLYYLEKYQPILYYSEADFGMKQMICIFENGLHVDLYVTTIAHLSKIGQILKVYDPNGILDNYVTIDHRISPKEFGGIVDSFCFTCSEFYVAYMRKDVAFATRLASHLFYDFTKLYRFKTDFTRASLGFKGILTHQTKEANERYMSLLKKIKLETLLEGVQETMVALNELVYNLPIEITANINFDFYEYTRRLILSIIR